MMDECCYFYFCFILGRFKILSLLQGSTKKYPSAAGPRAEMICPRGSHSVRFIAGCPLNFSSRIRKFSPRPVATLDRWACQHALVTTRSPTKELATLPSASGSSFLAPGLRWP
ncbi:hypothetical protein pipiens_016332 [Culex pipiens pipiens]|uniref:Secreted protein n=1 Tax=Culex pipiens pipiens TaxID=38569 RepID=A0ABD1CLQ7_CULPP